MAAVAAPGIVDAAGSSSVNGVDVTGGAAAAEAVVEKGDQARRLILSAPRCDEVRGNSPGKSCLERWALRAWT